MANILASILVGGEPLVDRDLAFDPLALLDPFILPASDAELGSVGLLTYEQREWDWLEGIATRVDSPPPSYIAMAGVEAANGAGMVTIPQVSESDNDDASIALWYVDENDLLDVVAVDVQEDIPRRGLVGTLQEFLSSGGSGLRRIDRERRCASRRSTLGCADRGCLHGTCEIQCWYDEKLRSTLYACECL
jgi:hypothetical protein